MGKYLLAALIALFCFAAPAAAEKRVALVIGNAAYDSQGKLSNPTNDASRIGALLKSRNFELIGNRPLADLNKSQFDNAIESFLEQSEVDVALVYYSGHGMQINGVNYLVPTDAPRVNESNLQFRFVRADQILTGIKAKLKIILLDACRDNPFDRSGRSGSGGTGLAQMTAPVGTIIAFATQPNTTASDGPAGTNSPYAAALLDAMRQPGSDQFRVFNDAALAVMRKTGGEQQPWMSASPIAGSFYFTPPLAVVASAPVTQALAQVMPPPAPLPAVVTNTSFVPNASPNFSLNYVQEANKLFQQLNYAGGRQILTEGISNGQKSAIMYSYRGFSWFQDGLNNSNPHEALAMFRAGFNDLDAAILLERNYPNSYRHRGNMIVASWKALKKTNQKTNDILDKAIADLQNATALDPTSMSSAYFLGEAYNLRGKPGDYTQAINWFTKANEINPKFVAPHSGLCYAKRMTGDMVGAQQEAEYAAKRDSDQASKSCLTADAWTRYVPKY